MSTAEELSLPEIRRMRSEDLDVVLAIEQASFSTPWSLASFRNLLARADADLWVAVVEDEVIGYTVVWYAATECELGNLAVAPQQRCRGVGRSLLEWTLRKAKERGAERVFLEVRVSNRVAQDLYRSRGFVQVGLRRRYYRAPTEDARVMCLDLVSEV
jgi:ribosomal-protein-alanine N-acetyltransferase